ncbi:MAG: bifunctional UDP-N-acetylglucosamine diphosphorylase/glucosamine-1-phosphate N-acetyltransferase GlmU [Burkholderiales bacterium]|nr:bifunctional UDP-N-acetylglucosamine diphosphorylase/glucosamine-1-phosphate N-acetyltransferase GlmU [Burkholderiales bacterium]
MSHTLSVVIMAAGLGQRMNSDLPKVLHSLGGQPLLAHVLTAVGNLNPHNTVVVVGHGANLVQAAFADRGLRFALQVPQHGTGHAVMQAAPHLPDEGVVLILNGDVPLVQAGTLNQVVAAAQSGALVLLTHELDDAGSYGRVVRGPDANIRRIVEAKDATAEERRIREWYTGSMAVPARHLKSWLARLGNQNVQKEYYLTDLVALAVTDGVPVTSIKAPTEWEVQGVNRRSEQARLERTLQQLRAQMLMEQGVTLADPARLDIRGSLSCGRDVTIDVNCVFEGSVKLGAHVQIGPHCVIRNATIEDGTRIEAFTHIDEADVGPGARIGPYARLRPGTTLGADVHIGNFVEVKASNFGTGSKANHLAYVGDSSVGSQVNIGAGTITCNYDGANKHRTIIEDNVHIGSDVQLVAPVTVKAGSTIAAGTTVWKDTAAGELTLNPKQQTTRPGWQRPVKNKKA